MSHRTFSFPIHCVLETRAPWIVDMGDQSDPEFSFRLAHMPKHGNEPRPMILADIFEVRRKAFEIRKPEDALELFRKFGPWQLEKPVEKPVAVKGISIRFSAVLSRCAFFQRALLGSSFETIMRMNHEGQHNVSAGMEGLYFWQPLQVSLTRQIATNIPVGVVRCEDIEDALRASVHLDLLEASAWQKCQREDCGALFSVAAKSKRKKLYCTIHCAHLQAVRNYNNKKTAARKKRKSGATAGRSKVAQDHKNPRN